MYKTIFKTLKRKNITKPKTLKLSLTNGSNLKIVELSKAQGYDLIPDHFWQPTQPPEVAELKS